MLPFLAPLLGAAGSVASGIGAAGLGALGAGGQLLGSGLATVAAPIASGIGAVGKGAGSLLGYKPVEAGFVGPPQKFSLLPALKTGADAGLGYGISSAMNPSTDVVTPPPVSYMPQMGDMGPKSQFAPQLGRFKPGRNYSATAKKLSREYGSGFSV